VKNIVIFGASGHARVVIDIVESQGLYRIAGILDSYRRPGPDKTGYSILGTENCLPELIEKHGIEGCIIAIGDNWTRHLVSLKLQQIANVRLISAFHRSAYVAPSACVGPGTVVMAGAVVGAHTRIGSNCIINTACSIDHDGVVEDFASLAPGVCTGGEVTIGSFSAVMIGAKISHRIRIGSHAVIGAGAVVLDDVADRVVAYGVPAREVRQRQPGDRYLARP
jgi:sugar O-acyltransferase (sialic acid O-acetyltransferase NeuD family)